MLSKSVHLLGCIKAAVSGLKAANALLCQPADNELKSKARFLDFLNFVESVV